MYSKCETVIHKSVVALDRCLFILLILNIQFFTLKYSIVLAKYNFILECQH